MCEFHCDEFNAPPYDNHNLCELLWIWSEIPFECYEDASPFRWIYINILMNFYIQMVHLNGILHSNEFEWIFTATVWCTHRCDMIFASWNRCCLCIRKNVLNLILLWYVCNLANLCYHCKRYITELTIWPVQMIKLRLKCQ